MGFLQRFSAVTFLILTLSFPITNAQNPTATAYDLLADYGFPIGILPKGVTAYSLDEPTGKFSASFNGTCSFSLEGSYQLSYRSTINGYLTKGRLANLEGVKVKLFWIWVDIVDVRRSGDDLEFSVGIASAGFPVDNFEECPQCGCGLRCGGGPVRKLYPYLNAIEKCPKCGCGLRCCDGSVRKARSNRFEFSVGIASAVFPVDSFKECPQFVCVWIEM
ncbi:hypothetical protein RHSIM_Rhsim07G0191500 [Rhododendron simsii]|uniref:DUF538 family protein n=1 Tax=Rhododendron simsii TaxID=118357 RepID=A0A834GKS4_RHOSS|nr:hypothetical protein RHSIM_Rhsim07G0191500 [Rhododendron simsii]